jgi:hypothetical protein
MQNAYNVKIKLKRELMKAKDHRADYANLEQNTLRTQGYIKGEIN